MYKSINEQSKRDYPTQTIHDCVRSACLLTPEKVAVLSGNDVLTYQELDQRSEAVANYLYQQGVRAGDLVGLCSDRYVDTPVLLLGILKSGAGYVPLDPDYPIDRLAYMVENSQLKRIIANTNQRELARNFDVPTLVIDKCWDAALAAGRRPDQTCRPREDVAYVIYTSGSTGKPKGVVVQHQAVVNFLLSMQELPGFRDSDRLLATTTLSFDISVLEMFLPLIAGGSVAIVDRETARDASALVGAMSRYDVNFMQATPAMWRMIVEAEFAGRPDMKFLTGGEPLPRDLIRPMLDRCGELWNVYGPTETTVWSTAKQIESDQGQILIGKPIANTQVYIVDEQGELCGSETPGELLIGGAGVTLGYHNRPELTAERFFDFQGQRVYRTGDLARLTESGELVHMGRIDSQIKFNGHRIELDEIDAALAKQPGVRQAATVLREDQPGDKRLVGYLLPSESETADLSQVRESVSRELPSYMVPNLLVSVDAFHYTPSGKLDRKAFLAPSTDRPELAVQYSAPKTKQEKRLAAFWQEQLQLDRVGTLDNFFELGGNSIRAAQVVARAEKELGMNVTPAEFFDNPTIQGFLRLAESKQQIARPRKARKRLPESEQSGFAIVGMAVRMPGARDLPTYWENLANGRESITRFSPEELDPSLPVRDTQSPNYVPARGIVDDVEWFDARFFGIPPRNAEVMDPQQRIVLELAWTALEDAGIVPSKTDATIGVWAGAYATNYFTKNIMSRPDVLEEFGEFNAGLFNEKDYIATRVAHALDLTGPAINVNTACSTSLVALIDGCRSLAVGDCDVAIAGGVSVAFPQKSGHLHQSGSIFTPDGHCRPFDASAAGTMFSDGAGLVVVKRLEDAIADGDRIYSVVKGYGINNDGGDKASFSAPSITGQASAIAMAQAMASVPADSISYIEAHGTATPIGDPIEVTALRSVFESQTDKKQFCGIGSVKSNIGHTVAAAGVAGLAKVALAMHHEQIPATLHYSQANPQIDFENSPFFVCDRSKDWPRGNQPRRAAVSSFGVGGTNAHIVLEEAPLSAAREDEVSFPLAVLPVSAKSKASLAATATELATALEGLDTAQIYEFASVLQQRRDDFPFRGVAVAQTSTEAAKALEKQNSPQFRKRRASPRQRDVVFMFPGQGAQYVRMGQDLYEHSLVFRESVDRCADVLEPLLGRDLRSVLFPPSGDEEAAQEILRNTRFTQPALFTLGYSLANLWQSWGIKPSAMVGHSIGEFAAACVAGVFKLEDALRIIAERGRAIEQLPQGSMLSVRLPGSEVEAMLTGDLAVGSHNGPQLCVVSGPSDQVSAFQQQLESQDVAAKLLHTSHAFHSPMMSPIVESFATFIQQFELANPKTPILSTVTGNWLSDTEATDARYWADHLCAPVHFSRAVTTLWDADDGDPSCILIELGPRRTLATLAMQHATDPKEQLAVATLSDNAADHAEWRSTLEALSTLWLAGINVDWAHVTPDGESFQHKHMTLPTYQYDRKRFFIEPASAAIESTAASVDVQPETIATTNIEQLEPTTYSQESLTVNRRPNIVEAVQQVFENTSGVELTEFDGETTFFEMGLDSLVLTQTAAAFERDLGIEVTFRQLLENTTTVDALAEWIDETAPTECFQIATAAETAEPPVANSPTVEHTPAEAGAPVQSIADQPVQPIPSLAAFATPVPVQPYTQALTGSTFGLPELAQMQLQSQLQLMNQQMQLFAAQPVARAALAQSAPDQTTPERASPVQATQERTPIGTVKSAPTSSAPKPTTGQRDASDELAPKAKRFKTVKLSEGELDERQQAALEEMTRSNCAMMGRSKAYAQEHRQYLADPRTVSGFRPNLKEMTHPIVVDRSSGVHLWDVDGNQYIDFTCGFGSNILGHAHEKIVDAITHQVQEDYSIGPQSPLAGEVAKLFCDITGHERMAFANTGSEAVLGCTRLARNYTGRDLIVMFNGDYHGILDEVTVRGSKKLKSFPAASGIPKEYVGKTLILDYGSDEALQIIEQNMCDIAAVLVEPVQSRQPELQPRDFLQKLGKLTKDEPAALIFDEVITGLRIGLGGAQAHFGVKADLASYGKIVGGGMPIGVVAGKARYMDGLDGGFWNYGDESRPEAAMTYFAGTFVRHPLTLSASKAILQHLKQGGKPMYDGLNRLADYLGEELNRVFEELDAPLRLEHFGSLFKIQFEQELAYSEVFFAGLRRRGMHIWEHRPCLLTFEHTHEHIDAFAKAAFDTIVECQQYGFMPGEGYKSATVQADMSRPPQVGAKAGTDDHGKPGWFVPDAQNPGQFLQVGVPLS